MSDDEICCTSAKRAACRGHLACLKTFNYRDSDYFDYIVTIREGHFDCFRNLHQSFRNMSAASMVGAEFGRLDILRHVYNMERELAPRCGKYAAHNGHLDCLRFIHDVARVPILSDNVELNDAIYQGHLDCVRYFVEEKGCTVEPHSLDIAVENGGIECVKYLLDRGLRSTNASWVALLTGNVHLFAFLHENYGANIRGFATNRYRASGGSQLECLCYARKHSKRYSVTDPDIWKLMRCSCTRRQRFVFLLSGVFLPLFPVYFDVSILENFSL